MSSRQWRTCTRMSRKDGRIKAISAAEKPVREADFGETRLRFSRQTLQEPPSARWRFDLGARLAGDELITTVTGAHRAMVFFTSGSLGQRPFTTYSLLEIADYLKNNAISFSPVLFGGGAPDDDLSFLAAATGGKVYSVSAPGGMPQVVRDLKTRVSSIYTLRFTAVTPADFGDRYIPLEVQVTVQKASGRDESGLLRSGNHGAAAALNASRGSRRSAGTLAMP